MKIVFLAGIGASDREFHEYHLIFGSDLLIVRYENSQTLDDFLTKIDEFIKQLERANESYILVGHSMGAHLIYEYINTRELNHAKGLIFIGGGPRFTPLRTWNSIFSLPDLIIKLVLLFIVFGAPFLYILYGWNGMVQRLSVIDLFRKNGISDIKSIYNKTLRPLTKDPKPLKKNIPGLLIRLQDDLLLPEWSVKEMHSLIPELEEIIIHKSLIHFSHEIDLLVVKNIHQWLLNKSLIKSKRLLHDFSFSLGNTKANNKQYPKSNFPRHFLILPLFLLLLLQFLLTFFDDGAFINILSIIAPLKSRLGISFVFLLVLIFFTFLSIFIYFKFLSIQIPNLEKPQFIEYPKVSIIVPMRNEARNIERHIRSLLNLDYPHYEIIISDGKSSDNSLEIANKTIQEYNNTNVYVKIIEELELKKGWIGKSWGCWNAVQYASGDYYLFTDADTYHNPKSLRKAIDISIEKGAVGLSLLGKIEVGSFWEKVTLPFFKSLMIILFHGRLTNSSSNRKLAIGQYILVNKSIYNMIGGHKVIKNKIADDIHLARKIADKGKFLTYNANSFYSVRMYRSLSEIKEGLERNAYESIGNNTSTAILASLGIFIWRLVPLLLFPISILVGFPTKVTIILFFFFIFGWVLFLVDTNVNNDPLYYMILMPLGIILLISILISSTRKNNTNTAIVWKERIYVNESNKSGNFVKKVS